ncbi:L-cysteine desulfidase [Alkalithermobacter thermoalcaliphilus JW-YL-7 = DSM 7308]|uniref:UPF0597 protein JWYL7_1352 n=1 Tax=Alkalithermobacter thermoalcaliphilus JW-YL-7 = DSM 7308 TaxID=1121328 RepID=A0A150FRN2_CLOPD|nr:UPF0597 protein yhaM [[Clostridium] paradoxum JW-YL-7 = DSM 7308]SHK39968.1 L-cysteine desulfidase [[Clostridium] paradoxum JW-YL-7 = DSM 7308]
MKEKLIKILKEEVKVAVGCTEPVAVALACAKAKELLDDEFVCCDILVSSNVYKNGMCVGIPKTEKIGLKIAASMGLVGEKSIDNLRVLENIEKEDILKAEKLSEKGIIKINPINTKEKVYVQVNLKGYKNESKVIIMGKHDQFVHLQVNDKIIISNDIDLQIDNTQSESEIAHMKISDLLEKIEELDFEDIKFLLEGINMNQAIADFAIENKIGAGVGYGIKKAIDDKILCDDLMNRAIMITAAASDARMSGINMPVMSSNGSGNHGITAILPISAYNYLYPQEDEKLAKALAISHLITTYIKNYTGRLSAVCGCGVAASTGAAAAIAYLMGCDYRKIEGCIDNMVANLSGMICDGAKAGCALKLASAAGAAVQSALMAKYNCIVPPLNGIIGKTVEESIKNLGKVSSEGMEITDQVIINVMERMNSN